MEATPLARPPRSVQEIAELEELSPSDLLGRVRDAGHELGLETLAYLIRIGLRASDAELVGEAATQILPRLEPIARRTAWGSHDWEDVYGEALATMWRDFFKRKDDELLFWEERFFLAFKRKCLTAMARMTRRAKAEEGLHGAIEQEGDSEGDEDLGDAVQTMDPRAIVLALGALAPQQRHAVVLAWRQGKPISGPGSVSEIMAISPSMVHRHLRAAERKFAELRETNGEFRRLIGLEE